MMTDPSSDTAVVRLDIRLPPRGEAAGIARCAVREALVSRGLDLLADDAMLLVSELVGNAVRHARRSNGAALELRLAESDGRLRIEVIDGDPRPPTPRHPLRREEEGGFGLVLVQALAHDWGVRHTGDGKAVWFELRVVDTALQTAFGQPAIAAAPDRSR
jgi:anti-sigma regulatory factor (Ser/Thr protein kinase)